MTKVLFVTHYSGLGGANRSLLDLTSVLQNMNIESQVLIPQPGPVCNELERRGIKYWIVKYYNWVEQSRENFFLRKCKSIIKQTSNRSAVRKISKIISENHIDVVHTNDSLSVIGVLAAKKCGVPHIWHLREFLDADYGFSFQESDRKVFETFNKSDKVIAISNQIYEKYENKIDDERLVRIYNGIPNKENAPVVSGDSFSTLKIAFSGGSSIAKGAWDCLKMAKELKSVSDIPFEIKMAGTFDNNEMREFITTNNLDENISILGSVTNWGEIRKECNVALVSSIREAFGRVTVEAMLDGLVVVGSNSGATPEIIQDRVTGFLYENGNIQQLVSIMKYIIKNPELSRQIASTGFSDAKARFEISITAKNVFDLYKQVLHGRQ